MFGYGMFGVLEAIFPIMFLTIFVIVIGTFLVTMIRGISQWNKNNHSPRLTVEAKVVSKRMNVSHHHHHHSDNMAMSHTSTSTSYYVTFEVESGDRVEFNLSGQEYGCLVEGDRGNLSFQGTRYLGFVRRIDGKEAEA